MKYLEEMVQGEIKKSKYLSKNTHERWCVVLLYTIKLQIKYLHIIIKKVQILHFTYLTKVQYLH